MIKLKNINKSFIINDPSTSIEVLKDINLEIHSQDFIAIMGPSGSGKSTLMNILGFLDKASNGDYIFLNEKIDNINNKKMSKLRNEFIGFVFQNFNLLPRMNVFQNVELPMIYKGISKKEREISVQNALTKVGLISLQFSSTLSLSGGQKQRVAIARAIVNNPQLIIADEPTGSLDKHNSESVMRIFSELNKEGVTIIIVTHDFNVAKQAKRILSISNGKLVRLKSSDYL